MSARSTDPKHTRRRAVRAAVSRPHVTATDALGRGRRRLADGAALELAVFPVRPAAAAAADAHGTKLTDALAGEVRRPDVAASAAAKIMALEPIYTLLYGPSLFGASGSELEPKPSLVGRMASMPSSISPAFAKLTATFDWS